MQHQPATGEHVGVDQVDRQERVVVADVLQIRSPPVTGYDAPPRGYISPCSGHGDESILKRTWLPGERSTMRSTFRSGSVLYGFAATGALFTCFAIVLNPFPLTKTPAPDLKRFQQEAFQSSGYPQIKVEREPQFKPIAQLAEKVAETSAPDRNLEETPTPPDFDDNRTAQAQATIVGVWAPDVSPCTVRTFREGFLPTIINTDGAWAGDTFCIFRNQKKTETGWGVIANCSNGRERWTAQVRLSVKGDRLTWTSKRGVQIYTRCTRDFLMAEAP